MSASIDLTTKADVKTHLGVTDSDDDDWIEAIIAAASAAIELWCRTEFKREARTEYHDGQGVADIVCRVRPIYRTTPAFEIIVNYDVPRDYTDSDDELDTDDYTVNYEDGVIHLTGQILTDGALECVKLTYTAGLSAMTADMPGDIQLATKILCAKVYNHAKEGAEGFSRDGLGPWAKTYLHEQMPLEVVGLLAPYREDFV